MMCKSDKHTFISNIWNTLKIWEMYLIQWKKWIFPCSSSWCTSGDPVLNSCCPHVEDSPELFFVMFVSALIRADVWSRLWITNFFRFSKSFDDILLRPRLLVYVPCLCLLTYVSYLLKQWCFMWPPKRQKSQKSSPERDFFLSQKDIMQMMVVRRTRRADTRRRKVNLDLLLVLNPVLCVLYGKDRHGSKWQNWEYKQTKQTEHTEWTSQHRGTHRA